MTRTLRLIGHLVLGIGLLAVGSVHAQVDAPKDKDKKDLARPQPGDQYRNYFRQPRSVDDFWAALQFEREVGRYDLAALHLHNLLAMRDSPLPNEKKEDFEKRKPQYDADLIKLHDRIGIAPLLQLRGLPEWQRVAALPEFFKKDKPEERIDPTKDANELVARVIKAVKAERENTVRIKMLAGNLLKAQEEHDYALQELYLSGAAAIPPLIQELQRERKQDERRTLLDAMVRLSPETIPALVAALDSPDAAIQADMIDVLRRRGAIEATPNLWYLAGSPDVLPSVQRRAKETLAAFLDKPIDQLPPARVMLTREAERYYRHEVTFADPKSIVIWHWDEATKTVVAGLPGEKTVGRSKAELHYGLYFARKALAIDPKYEPAQVVLLSLSLEKAMEDFNDPTQLPPRIRELLTTLRPELWMAVLDRALAEKRTLVVLGAVRALGELGEVKAAYSTGENGSGLVQALRYPDQRVRFAAALALTRVPLPTYTPDADRTGGVARPPQPVAPVEVVRILSQAITAEPNQGKVRVMIGYADNQMATKVAAQVQRYGYDVVRAESGRAILRRLRDSSDIDLVLLDLDLPDPGFPYILSQIRAMPQGKKLPVVFTIDVRPGAVPRSLEETLRYARQVSRKAELELEVLFPAFERDPIEKMDNDRERAYRALEVSGKLPPNDLRKLKEDTLRAALERESVLISARIDQQRATTQAREDGLRRFLEGDAIVSVYPVSLILDQEGLHQVLRQGVDMALPEAEQKAMANEAMILLGRMARGDLPGYDVRPADDAVLAALRDNRLSEEATSAAVAIVARIPTARGQTALEDVLLKPYPLRIRVEAGDELVRNLQRNRVLLAQNQIDAVVNAFAQEKDGPIKARMGMVVGVINRDPQRTGELLRGFDPVPKKPADVKPPDVKQPDKPNK